MAATFRLGMVSDANSIEDQNSLSPRQLRHWDVCCGLPQSTHAVAQHVSQSWVILMKIPPEDAAKRSLVVAPAPPPARSGHLLTHAFHAKLTRAGSGVRSTNGESNAGRCAPDLNCPGGFNPGRLSPLKRVSLPRDCGCVKLARRPVERSLGASPHRRDASKRSWDGGHRPGTRSRDARLAQRAAD